MSLPVANSREKWSRESNSCVMADSLLPNLMDSELFAPKNIPV